MGMHSHKCLACQHNSITSKIDAICEVCGESMALDGSAGVSNFKSFWHPHLGHEPVFIDSAKTLDTECVKRNVFIKESPANEKQVRLPQSKEEAQHV